MLRIVKKGLEARFCPGHSCGSRPIPVPDDGRNVPTRLELMHGYPAVSIACAISPIGAPSTRGRIGASEVAHKLNVAGNAWLHAASHRCKYLLIPVHCDQFWTLSNGLGKHPLVVRMVLVWEASFARLGTKSIIKKRQDSVALTHVLTVDEGRQISATRIVSEPLDPPQGFCRTADVSKPASLLGTHDQCCATLRQRSEARQEPIRCHRIEHHIVDVSGYYELQAPMI
mmetsp:Transcript_45116/g.79396  ORF Transcript_45116/g.79396 Transcript_45116/m.79396 type:complete len:228 (-) Transcript_45116:568-1251(-)